MFGILWSSIPHLQGLRFVLVSSLGLEFEFFSRVVRPERTTNHSVERELTSASAGDTALRSLRWSQWDTRWLPPLALCVLRPQAAVNSASIAPARCWVAHSTQRRLPVRHARR
jgi:hypothetical protein